MQKTMPQLQRRRSRPGSRGGDEARHKIDSLGHDGQNSSCRNATTVLGNFSNQLGSSARTTESTARWQEDEARIEETLMARPNIGRCHETRTSSTILIRLSSLAWMIMINFVVCHSFHLMDRLVVDAWLIPQPYSKYKYYTTRATRKMLYANDGEVANSTASRLFYQNHVNATTEDTTILIDGNNMHQFFVPVVEESISSGSFGDIMAPSIDDADVLFRDGLITKETKSLSQTYGITNPLDRMAVTANGNLQRLFSSYYDAPVVVKVEHCTQQARDNGNNPATWNRRVLLQIYNQTFCTADSVVVVHSAEVEELIETGTVGIGQLFRHFNVLPEFALLAAGPLPGGGFWRNYTLTSQQLVTCQIHEVFCSDVWNLQASPGN